MKFTKGFWVNKEGVTTHGAIDIRSAKITETVAVFTVTPQKIFHRGQTLGGPVLTVEITSPAEDVLSVKAYHYKGVKKQTPSFDIADGALKLNISENEKEYVISSGKLSAVFKKELFDMAFYYDGKFLTRSEKKQLAYMQTPEGAFFRERLDISVDEYFYGTGERFTSFVKNGQSVDIWNEDGGTASELAYKNIPFLLSNRGYGIFVNHPENVSFEIGSESVSKNQFSVAGESLNYFIIGGGSMEKAVSNYTLLTGKPAMPPAWSFGLWLSTSFTTDYNEETVNHFVDGMISRGIPLSVFHFDCFWMKEFEWCNFTWDEAQFPNVREMLARLKEKGLKICVWINPYIGQKSPLFDEGMENGYLLKRKNGDVWQWDMWQPAMAIVDFTNPAACKWYCEKLSNLVDLGVDSFKTDFGERIPTDCAWFDGSDPEKMHNYYAYLYNKVVFEMLKGIKPEEAVVFARSASAGSQKFPVHWGGDCDATYVSMAESLRGGLSLALCGFGFWSHDIGGFESTATADLYKRWVAFGMLSSHSRLHGSTSYRVPWLFDEEAVDVLRYFTNLKHVLMPYLYAQAQNTCLTGISMMRPMVMAFPQDYTCTFLDKQYMLGDSLLVAPVFSEDGVCTFYLPEGKFTDLITKKTVKGGRYITQIYDYKSIPLYVKENSMIACGKHNSPAVYDYSKDVQIEVYELREKEIYLYDNFGNKKASVYAKRTEDKIEIQVRGEAPGLRFVFYNLILDDGSSAGDPKGFTFKMPEDSPKITLSVKDSKRDDTPVMVPEGKDI
ncbi:MAG: alpha-xylosidase [Clostridiales bacterium]|jgi:alpha-D-xyloside xylohydrolase|nr:alpha-xylosidase [Clostridiales bacterium]